MSLLSKLVWHLSIKPRLRNLQILFPGAKIFPTGSRWVCNPPVISTDIDFLVYFEKETEIPVGWKNDGSYPPGDLSSFRRGSENLIITTNAKWAGYFCAATHFCKEHNVKSKFQRCNIYSVFRGDVSAVDLRGSYVWDNIPEIFKDLAIKLTGPNRDFVFEVYRAQNNIPNLGDTNGELLEQ